VFKNVLVGVDGRPNGRDAIALASRLTDPDGKLTLAHIHVGPGSEASASEAATTLLEQERAACDVSAELVGIRSDSPGRGLHQQAEAHDVDLLVVGSCSHGAFGRAMLGDDTRSALNGASCAVAIAPLGYAQHPDAIAKVGVGYNGSQESQAALAMARQLAARTNATVHVLEVVSIPTYAYTGLMPPAIGESIDMMLQAASARMKGLHDVDERAVYGITGEELAAFSEELDILIVGSRSYGPVRRLVLGSTSDYLERNARSALLVLPRVAAGPNRDSGTSVESDTDTGRPRAEVLSS
jgi:nucleotide-binding universal stress UspA family protein